MPKISNACPFATRIYPKPWRLGDLPGDNFKLLGAQGVCCAYVILEGRENYRYKAISENPGVPWCFTLHWHHSELGPFAVTADWGRLIGFLRESLSAVQPSMRI